ncbi:MAG: rhomboid family intramembrane serine protease [Microbacterium sp.]|uniref:rhomboid family intramembrane serine protease n=1 Tax=Microbacterium sp. TaxID=51671 RepID=UPI0039E44BD7
MTSTEFAANRDNFCYRHPDRQSFVLCQRCLRTICPECQTQAPVGVVCPECMSEQRKAQTSAQRTAARRSPSLRALPMRDSRPLATYGVIGVTSVAYLLQLIPGVGDVILQALAFNSAFVTPAWGGPFEPWRLLTVMLTHSGFLHLALNMFALLLIGRSLEPLLGHGRFLALYALSVLGGSVAVALLAPGTWVVGASGGIFGLFGALLVIGRHIGANIRGIAIIIAINFALPFILALVGSIASGSLASALEAIRVSWQAHLGGLAAGAATAFIYARTRSRRAHALLLAAIAVALCLLLLIPPLVYT